MPSYALGLDVADANVRMRRQGWMVSASASTSSESRILGANLIHVWKPSTRL